MSATTMVHGQISLHDFNEIAQDVNDAQVELYAQLDASDLIKLIIATTQFNNEAEEKMVTLGWREVRYTWKKEWLAKLRDAQLLPAFYVYIKRFTRT
jgi:hypothetical protein